ncbi:Zc3h12a-like Ribonuclease NYN domain [Pelomyxa schiedti]|nr:Zc3h12a-like Ribonuclease NYN domain [Pelomyxa schiedti]
MLRRCDKNRALGSVPLEVDLQTAVFSPATTFVKGETVMVPRSQGGFSYGVVDSCKVFDRCFLFSSVRHTSQRYRVAYPNQQAAVQFKDLPNFCIGKLLSDSPVPASSCEDTETERSPGCSVNIGDLHKVVFLPRSGIEPGCLVIVPRSRGGFTYGRVVSEHQTLCREEPSCPHTVMGARVLLSPPNTNNPVRKDLPLCSIGVIPLDHELDHVTQTTKYCSPHLPTATIPTGNSTSPPNSDGTSPSSSSSPSPSSQSGPASNPSNSPQFTASDKLHLIAQPPIGFQPHSPVTSARESLRNGVLHVQPGVTDSSKGGESDDSEADDSGEVVLIGEEGEEVVLSTSPNDRNNYPETEYAAHQNSVIANPTATSSTATEVASTGATYPVENPVRLAPLPDQSSTRAQAHAPQSKSAPVISLPEISRAKTKPYIVLDGPNIACKHSKKSNFSAAGLKIAVEHLSKAGFEPIAFVPEHYVSRKQSHVVDPSHQEAGVAVLTLKDFMPVVDDTAVLSRLIHQKKVVLTPPQDLDSSYFINFARMHDACIVTNNNFSDFIAKQEGSNKQITQEWLDKHCLPFKFNKNTFQLLRKPKP